MTLRLSLFGSFALQITLICGIIWPYQYFSNPNIHSNNSLTETNLFLLHRKIPEKRHFLKRTRYSVCYINTWHIDLFIKLTLFSIDFDWLYCFHIKNPIWPGGITNHIYRQLAAPCHLSPGPEIGLQCNFLRRLSDGVFSLPTSSSRFVNHVRINKFTRCTINTRYFRGFM